MIKAVHWCSTLDGDRTTCGRSLREDNGHVVIAVDPMPFIRFAKMSAHVCRRCRDNAVSARGFEHAFPPREEG